MIMNDEDRMYWCRREIDTLQVSHDRYNSSLLRILSLPAKDCIDPRLIAATPRYPVADMLAPNHT